jgi:hypothetical protein
MDTGFTRRAVVRATAGGVFGGRGLAAQRCVFEWRLAAVDFTDMQSGVDVAADHAV